MSGYILSIAAQSDIDEIIDYLLDNASVEVAAKVNDRLEEALQKISQHPELGHLRSDLSEDPMRFWLVDSYLILYLAEASPIAVVRVLHGKRDIKEIVGDA